MLCRFVLTKCLMFAQKVCLNSKGQGGVNMIALPEHFAWQPQAQQALANGIARCFPTGPNSRRVKLFKYPSVCGSLKFAEVNLTSIGTYLVIRSDRFLSNPCLSHPITLSRQFLPASIGKHQQLNGGTTSCSEKRRFPGLSLSSGGHAQGNKNGDLSALAVCQNLVPLVNIKIAGKWMFIPLKMVLY